MIYSGIGLALCLVVSRIDYTRLREFRYVVYGADVALNIVVYGMPARGERPPLDPGPAASTSSHRSSASCC